MSRRRQIAGSSAYDATPRFVALSRVLVALIGLLLLVTPWTEGYRLLDNFPRGQDSEVHMLALLVFLGLVLLLARSRTRNVSVVLSVAFWLSAVLRHMVRISFTPQVTPVPTARHVPPIPRASCTGFSLPLQV